MKSVAGIIALTYVAVLYTAGSVSGLKARSYTYENTPAPNSYTPPPTTGYETTDPGYKTTDPEYKTTTDVYKKPEKKCWTETKKCCWEEKADGYECIDHYAYKCAVCYPKIKYHRKCDKVKADDKPKKPKGYVDHGKEEKVKYDSNYGPHVPNYPAGGESKPYDSKKLPTKPYGVDAAPVSPYQTEQTYKPTTQSY